MTPRLKLTWIVGLLLCLGVGCTLAAEVDRSKIDAEGQAGESNQSEE